MQPLPFLLIAFMAATTPSPEPMPFELHKNVIFVKASIGNSESLDVALDSGTIYTTLDESVAARLGLDLSMKAKSSGANGIQEISVIKDQVLGLGGVEVHEPMMVAYPLEFLSKRLGRRVDAIIGVELLRKYVVEIDYPAAQLRIITPEAFKYAGPGDAVPVTYHRRLPLIAATVKPRGKEPIATRFQVDTGGSAASVALWKDFIAKGDLLAGAQDLSDVEVTGFGGTRTWKRGRIEAIEIGKVRVAEPEVHFAPYQFGDVSVFGGNLGTGFLKQFKVIFDLPHDRIVFERPAGR